MRGNVVVVRVSVTRGAFRPQQVKSNLEVFAGNWRGFSLKRQGAGGGLIHGKPKPGSDVGRLSPELLDTCFVLRATSASGSLEKGREGIVGSYEFYLVADCFKQRDRLFESLPRLVGCFRSPTIFGEDLSLRPIGRPEMRLAPGILKEFNRAGYVFAAVSASRF